MDGHYKCYKVDETEQSGKSVWPVDDQSNVYSDWSVLSEQSGKSVWPVDDQSNVYSDRSVLPEQSGKSVWPVDDQSNVYSDRSVLSEQSGKSVWPVDDQSNVYSDRSVLYVDVFQFHSMHFTTSYPLRWSVLLGIYVHHPPVGLRVETEGWSNDDPAIIERWPTGEWKLADLHLVTRRCPFGFPSENGWSPFSRLRFFSANYTQNSGRCPTGRRAEAGRRPAGRLPMSEFAWTQTDRRANFNCELKCSGRRRDSPRRVLCRPIICRFSTGEYSSGSKTRSPADRFCSGTPA